MEDSARSFVIVTTGDSPEAYALARFLIDRQQRVAIVTTHGRPLREQLRVLRRLARRRGLLYLLDFLPVVLVLRRYVAPRIAPAFPEIDAAAMVEIRASVSHHVSADLHAPPTLDFVKRFEPDYMLLAGAPVIRPALYELARHGALNRHHGISPAYRGSDVPIWAMALGDFDAIGYTIHFVTKRVDGGSIVLQREVELAPGLDFWQANAQIGRTTTEGFLEVLADIVAGKELAAAPQAKGGKHYPPAALSTLLRARRRYGRHMRAARDPRRSRTDE